MSELSSSISAQVSDAPVGSSILPINETSHGDPVTESVCQINDTSNGGSLEEPSTSCTLEQLCNVALSQSSPKEPLANTLQRPILNLSSFTQFSQHAASGGEFPSIIIETNSGAFPELSPTSQGLLTPQLQATRLNALPVVKSHVFPKSESFPDNEFRVSLSLFL